MKRFEKVKYTDRQLTEYLNSIDTNWYHTKSGSFSYYYDSKNIECLAIITYDEADLKKNTYIRK